MKLKADYEALLTEHVKNNSPELEILHHKEGKIITLHMPPIAGYKVELFAKKYTDGGFTTARYLLYNQEENLVFVRDLINPDFNQIADSLGQPNSL